jgi:hypothetical protein
MLPRLIRFYVSSLINLDMNKENLPGMNKCKFLKTDPSASSIIKILVTMFLIPVFMLGAYTIAQAKQEWTPEFNSYYGTFGTEGGTTMGSCITCHINPDGKGGLDPYGIDLKIAGIKNNRPAAFAATEPLDSDGDGFDNLTEILTDFFPGDPADHPGTTNSPPVADAGPDQTVDEGANVTLNGSGSYDPDGVIASYSWTQTGGMPVTLSGSTTDSPTFSAPQVGPGDELLTFSLTVTDNDGDLSSDLCTLTISWVNDPPLADAGLDQTVGENVQVALDGSNSTDPDGGIATYQWLQTSGPPVTLSDPAAIQPTFISPIITSGGVTLNFQLTVTDGFGLSATDTSLVNVTNGNQPPVANAGGNQTVNEGDIVTLDATASIDPDGTITSYQWVQTAGPQVTLTGASTAQPAFTAPDVGLSGESLSFELTVTDDGGLQATDTCIVNVSWVNLPPTADAGPDQTGTFSVEAVTLDGSGSNDPDDGIVSYLWEQTGTGPAVTLSDPTAIQPTFVTPVIDAGEVSLTFQLTVTDSGGLQAGDVVTVSIYDNGIAGFPAGAITVMSAGGSPIGITEDGGGNITRLDIVDPAALPGNSGTPGDLMLGLIDLQVKTGTPGATATFTIYLSQPAPSGYKWYKYNSATNDWTDYGATTTLAGVKGAVFNTARDQVTLTLVDGDVGDDDGVANGTIEDPSGLGASIGSIDVIGSNNFGPAGGCFIAAAVHSHPDIPSTGPVIIWSLLLISFAVAVWYRKAKPRAG